MDGCKVKAAAVGILVEDAILMELVGLEIGLGAGGGRAGSIVDYSIGVWVGVVVYSRPRPPSAHAHLSVSHLR